MNQPQNQRIEVIELGSIDYQKAWDYQEELLQQIIDIKFRNRKSGTDGTEPTPNYLLICEHPPVFTLGKSGKEENLLADDEKLSEIGASYYKINRGGDITYHGPGQLVVYPVLDLENFFTDIHLYLRVLEEAVILTLREYQIEAGRVEGLTGVWVDFNNLEEARKICAMGVRTSRWVTMHGLALNINTDLTYFDYIVPCGIDDKAVTSMKEELGTGLEIRPVTEKLIENISFLMTEPKLERT